VALRRGRSALRLRDYHQQLEVSPGRLDEIETRLALLERLEKKYGATVEEVLAFGARCRRELDALLSPEEQERTLEARRERLAASYLERARVLSKRRRAAALELRKRVQSELAQLAMEKTRFEVAFTPEDAEATVDPSEWSERGLERAEFLLSPNPGEELRPLARIASGGELSRIMLGLKSVVRSDVPGLTLVFDEVDAGIGGVTHLPQIAALADQHLAVRKRVEKGRTITFVEPLAAESRVEEVARMLGGQTITDTTRQHAREMLKQGLRT
jgi:DNA repair protein RecN (Recombination protein N)